MRVTLVADASFAIKEKHNAAGWAAFIACSRGKRYYGAAMHKLPCNNIVAEMMAIVNGLHKGLDGCLIEWGDHVLIQSDCIPAMDSLHKAGANISKFNRNTAHKQQVVEVANVFEQLIVMHNLTYEMRHVRGHNGVGAPRDYVQDQCDRIAKRHMASLAKKLRTTDENNRERPDAGSRGTSNIDLPALLESQARRNTVGGERRHGDVAQHENDSQRVCPVTLWFDFKRT